jgi:hypothetical protein
MVPNKVILLKNNGMSEFRMIEFSTIYRKEAGVEIDGHFMIRVIYNDADTYALVEAACKILSKNSHQINIIYK